MNEILKNFKHNSKRNKILNSTYKTSSSMIIKNKASNAKYIIIKAPTQKSFLKIIPRWFFKLSFYSAILGFTLYNYSKIKEKVDKSVKHFNEKTKNYLSYLITSRELRQGGLELLDNIFKNKHSKNSTVELLNGSLEDQRVMEDLKLYGVGLFNQLLREEELKLQIKKIFLELLQMEEVHLEGVKILKFMLEKEECKDIMAQYFKVIFLRSDIIKNLSSLITDSAIYSMSKTSTKKKFAEFIIDVWSDPNLRWYVIKKTLNFWQPSSSTVISRK